MCVLAFARLESVARYGPEDECQSRAQDAATRTVTQTARPIRSFFTYGSRMVSVRKGVVSDWRKKMRIGSCSYWYDIRKRTAKKKGIYSCGGNASKIDGVANKGETRTQKRTDLG
jgi:hypothetical protein